MCMQKSASVARIYWACICCRVFLAKNCLLLYFSHCSISKIKWGSTTQAEWCFLTSFFHKSTFCAFSPVTFLRYVLWIASIWYFLYDTNLEYVNEVNELKKKYLGSTGHWKLEKAPMQLRSDFWNSLPRGLWGKYQPQVQPTSWDHPDIFGHSLFIFSSPGRSLWERKYHQ